jgi:hypothetical protein
VLPNLCLVPPLRHNGLQTRQKKKENLKKCKLFFAVVKLVPLLLCHQPDLSPAIYYLSFYRLLKKTDTGPGLTQVEGLGTVFFYFL